MHRNKQWLSYALFVLDILINVKPVLADIHLCGPKLKLLIKLFSFLFFFENLSSVKKVRHFEDA